MPFDGILTKNIADELNNMLSGGRIGKIHQIGKDTLILQIRAHGENRKLFISCNPSSAGIYLTEKQYDNPASPPVFCMLLRKHLSGGIIKSFETIGFERVITMSSEIIDELGDRSVKKLVVEIMGRHSNIILLNSGNMIIDAIKHVDMEVNRVRELLPARSYVPPPAQDKLDPSEPATLDILVKEAPKSGRKIESFLLDRLQGFSPVLCREICFRAEIDDTIPACNLSFHQLLRLAQALEDMMKDLEKNGPAPCLVIDTDLGKPVDFHCVRLSQYASNKDCGTISMAVEAFHAMKNKREFKNQRANDLRKHVEKLLGKCEKRLGINIQTYEDNKDFERLRLYGELITANIYSLSKGMESAALVNYYSEDSEIADIPLDKNKSPQGNAQAYFKRYNKSRTAFLYAKKEIEALKAEISYLESVLFSIDNAESADELSEIRLELHEQGYLKKSSARRSRKKPPVHAEPLKIVSRDGFEILIGRNNKQNDRLTLKTARKDDIWLHIKKFSGSHVIIRTEGRTVPDTTLTEAAGYAVWFSKARSASKAEVDYTAVRNVNKPSGAKPGMVIYFDYRTIMAEPKAPELL